MISIMRKAIVASMVICGLVLLFLPSATAAFKHIREGMTAPVAEGVDLKTGAEISSDPNATDSEISIVAFWATWSRRSLELLADLEAMKAEFEGHPLTIIGVNVEGENISDETRKRVEDMVDELAITFPIIVDDKLEIFYDYGVIAVPSTAVISKSGMLEYGPAGYSYYVKDAIRDTIQQRLGLAPAVAIAEPKAMYTPKKDSARRYSLAVRLSNQRHYDRALKQVEQAIEADSGFAAPFALKGDLLLSLDRQPEAAEAFSQAAGLDENSTVAFAGWGRALLRGEDTAGAVEKLSKALEIDPTYTPAIVDLARCRIALSEFDEAIRLLGEAAELNQADPEIPALVGRAHRGAGRLDDSVEAYRKALEMLYPAP